MFHYETVGFGGDGLYSKKRGQKNLIILDIYDVNILDSKIGVTDKKCAGLKYSDFSHLTIELESY